MLSELGMALAPLDSRAIAITGRREGDPDRTARSGFGREAPQGPQL
jgi:hypothetical protein